MKVNFSLTSLFITLILLSGCQITQPKYHVNVDSIGSSSDNKKSYILLPGNKATNSEDLQFKEYANYVNRALVSSGFKHAESYEKANVAIILMYGIGDPQTQQYSYSTPTWGQTGVSSSQTYGTVNTYGNYGSYSGTTTYTPQYGITGSTTQSGSYATYLRYMIISAVDLTEYNKSKKEVQLWKTTVTSSGTSGDLRKVFPVLVAASKSFIATNTGEKVKVEMHDTDKSVIDIKGIKTENSKQ